MEKPKRVTAETGYGLASGYPKNLLGDAVIGYAVCLVLDHSLQVLLPFP
jgi:hypothetical protein